MPPLDQHGANPPGGHGAAHRAVQGRASPYPRRYPPQTWAVQTSTARAATAQTSMAPERATPPLSSGRVAGMRSAATPAGGAAAPPMAAASRGPVQAPGRVPAETAPVFDTVPDARVSMAPPAYPRPGTGDDADPAGRGWRLRDTIPAALAGLGGTVRLKAPLRGRHDPSPSRLAYRMNRLWLTPSYRRALTMGLPATLLAAGIALFLADEGRRGAITDLRLAFENRPEFRVTDLEVRADSPVVRNGVAAILQARLPASSFHLDLEALRRGVERLDAVESASLRIRGGGLLEVTVMEREPAFVWRMRDGLALIDADGHRVALLGNRAARADLPLIVGEGAPQAVGEARRILAAAEPLAGELFALVRMGGRRWDLVLTGDRRIMLPAQGAVTALERALALDGAPMNLLARDITAVDLRNPDRPTIRLSQTAMAELHRNRQPDTGDRPR